MAIALADTVYQGYSGTGRFEGQQLPMTRALASLYANMIQIATLADSDITSLQDLKGKRVSVGAPGSGTEVNAQTLLNANGITYDDIEEQRLNFNETADALRNGDIDAGFWSVGAPTSSILNLATDPQHPPGSAERCRARGCQGRGRRSWPRSIWPAAPTRG